MHVRVSHANGTKLAVVAEGTGDQVLAGLTSPILWFAESYPSISIFSIAHDRHFLVIVPMDFWFLLDLIRCRWSNLNIIITLAIVLFLARVSVTRLLIAAGTGWLGAVDEKLAEGGRLC